MEPISVGGIFQRRCLRALALLIAALVVGCSEHKEVRVGGPPGSRTPPPPHPAAVYNAVFHPTESGSLDNLTDATPTTVSFYIGPRSTASAAEGSDQAVNPKILKSD